LHIYTSFFYPFHALDISEFRSILGEGAAWNEERPSLDSSLYPFIRRLFRKGERSGEGFTLKSNPESPQFMRLRKGAQFVLPRIAGERLRALMPEIDLDSEDEIPTVTVAFTSAKVHGFSTGMGIVVLEAEYSINRTGMDKDEIYQHLVLEVLGSITHAARTMKGRLRFDSVETPVSLLDVFRELCGDLVCKSRSEVECVRIPSYSLVITESGLENKDEFRLFSHKVARRHTSAYQTLVEEDHKVATYTNIEFTSTFEGTSLWLDISEQPLEFFKQFRTSSWRTAYQPIHTLVLHEYFYLNYLQEAMSRRVRDLQNTGNGWFSSKSSLCKKEDEELLSEMRNYLLRFRSHNVSSLQHHNDIYQMSRNVLGLPQTLAVIESDFQAIQAERTIQVQRETMFKNRTFMLIGYIAAAVIAVAGVVSGFNDAMELAKKFDEPVHAPADKN